MSSYYQGWFEKYPLVFIGARFDQDGWEASGEPCEFCGKDL